MVYKALAEIYKYEEEPVKERKVTMEIPDDDEDSEAGHNDEAVDKDGKKINAPK